MREIAQGEKTFGEPVEVAGRKVIPVAAVGRLFDGRIAGEAPLGALEVTAEQTRFVPMWDERALAGVGLGLLLGRLVR